jgi:hypothetical protein
MDPNNHSSYSLSSDLTSIDCVHTRTHTAIANTRCTGHFLQIDLPCENKTATNQGIYVNMLNNTCIRVTHTCTINIPGVPHAACSGHIFPQLKTPLVSIGQLCDHDCIATFDKTRVVITQHNATLLTGFRSPTTNLWQLPLTTDTSHNNITTQIIRLTMPTNRKQNKNSTSSYMQLAVALYHRHG